MRHGGAAPKELPASKILKTISVMCVDDILISCRPGTVKLQAALASLFLALIGRPESSEKAAIQPFGGNRAQEIFVHLGMAYVRIPEEDVIKIGIPGRAKDKLLSKIEELKKKIRREEEEEQSAEDTMRALQ